MKKVLCAGEINVDLVLQGYTEFPVPGKEVLVQDFAMVLGSATAIMAMGLARLGTPVAFVGRVGDDVWGHYCLDDMASRGIDLSRVIRGGGLKTGVTVSITHPRDRALVTYLGAISALTGADVPNRDRGAEPADADWPGIENAIQALQSSLNQRRALLYLAERTGAFLGEDIALSGTDIVVARLSQALTNEYSSGSMTGGASLGWLLERTACGLLATLLSSDQATPELEAILIRHTGQVGRNVSTLEELTAGASSVEEFQKLLVRENFIYLEDISPAARARAFEWLKARGRAPEGYHPLAPVKERRAVLNRVEKGFDLE